MISRLIYWHKVGGSTKIKCHDLSLKFATKARAWKGASQESNLGVTFKFSRVWESVKEWVHTFPNGFPFWELESQWTLKYSKSGLRSQNSLDKKLPYIVGIFLTHKWLKWALSIWILMTQVMAEINAKNQKVDLTLNH
jgi:hypothetical protein